jgi:V/A-type H+-transporting ATPase subunit A
VYLQQNTFDAVDGATPRSRQQYVFTKVASVLKSGFNFEEKEEARRWFLELRQLFIDWNYEAVDSGEFKTTEASIDVKIRERAANV